VTLAIAHVGTIDEGGGAAAVASGLVRASRARGHQAWHVVGRKRSADPHVVVLPDDDRALFRATGYTAVQTALRQLAGRFPDRGFGRVGRMLRLVTHPRAMAARFRGLDDNEFPATVGLVDRLGLSPDIVHLHNLHGGYFDVRALAAISAQVPTFVTLHDMWMLTGHCAHSLGCERWTSGCGCCPDLGLDPAVRRDATDDNWRGKQATYARSRLHVATPSRWLGEKLAASMLQPAIASRRVIPNGVDTSIFQPADRQRVRRELGLPLESVIVMLTTGSRGSMWKDDATLRDTMKRVSRQDLGTPVLFLAIGRESAVTGSHGAATRSIAFQYDPKTMAKYYQASDLYLHASRADTAPLAVLEAMACATPVVAGRVGGIPEQIAPVPLTALRAEHADAIGDATGVLVSPESGLEMAEATSLLIARPDLRALLGANAARSVTACFSLDRQVERYLEWYGEVLAADRAAARKNAS
jgi:glycosyltransferase involved in cell wall biosynthesis